MSRYSDQVRDEYGRTVPGVSIYVYKWDADADAAGDLETLTDDLSAPLANPLTSDADGLFYFNSVDGQKLIEYHFGGKVEFRDLILVGDLPVPQAVYGGLFVNASALTIPVGMDMIGTTGYATLGVGGANYVNDPAVNVLNLMSYSGGAFISANGRGFRLDREQDISLLMFGGVADDNGSVGTDNLPAWNAAMAYLEFLANPSSSLAYHTSQKLVAPAGDYYFSGTANIKLTTLTVEGDGSFYAGPGTNFRFPAGCHGIVVNSYNTEAGVYVAGDADIASPRFRGADFSVVRYIRVLGPSSGSGNYDGIHLNVRALIDRCCTKGWARAGIGIVANASATDATAGNANNWQVIGGRHEYNKVAGLYVEGADANAGWAQGVDCSFNGQYGVYDNSFLGNTYLGCHTEYNGQLNGGYEGTLTNPPSCVSSGGNRYTIAIGQAVGASTNAPSGTTADNTWWLYYGAGGVDGQVPAWVSGMALSEGGAYYMKADTAANVLLGCYVESGQSPAKGGAATVAIGGALVPTALGSMVYLTNNLGRALFSRPVVVQNKTGTNTARITLGGSTAGDLILFENNAGRQWELSSEGGLHITGGATGTIPFFISSPDSGINFGRSTAQSDVLFSQTTAIGYSNAARIVSMGTAAPATGDRAQGEIMFNSSVTLTAPARWVCTVGHATTGGTWGADYIYARAEPLTGVGYVTGAGGAVTQASSRTTGVTLNKVCGAITLVSAAGSASWQTFTVTNSAVAATDVIRINQKSGTDKNMIHVTAVAAGSFDITFATTGGTTTEQPVFNFAVIKAVAA